MIVMSGQAARGHGGVFDVEIGRMRPRRFAFRLRGRRDSDPTSDRRSIGTWESQRPDTQKLVNLSRLALFRANWVASDWRGAAGEDGEWLQFPLLATIVSI